MAVTELQIDIDLPDTNKPEFAHLKEKVDSILETLMMDVYQFLKDKASLDLKSRKKPYLDALSPPSKEKDGIYGMSLDSSATWIEEGLPSGFDMVPGLLASPKAKIGKNGRYLVVPFNLSQKPNTETKQHLQNVLKKQLRKEKIPFKKLESDDKGRPKLGTLHTLDIEAPDSPSGKPMKSQEGLSYLSGVGIFQKSNKSGKVERKASTFRTVTENHSGTKWIHPGLTGFGGLEAARQYGQQRAEELVREFNDEINKKPV